MRIPFLPKTLVATGLLTLGCIGLQAGEITPLGKKPRWQKLDPFQGQVTRGEFESALREVYSADSSWKSTIKVDAASATIREMADKEVTYELEFLREGEQTAERNLKFWRAATELPELQPGQPVLSGLKIAIDPGHIGGEWAKMEERCFQLDDGSEIKEGDLTLLTAQILKPMLEALGARVNLVRDSAAPLTTQRPRLLQSRAKLFLVNKGFANPPPTYSSSADKSRFISIQWQAEKLFYRTAEIRSRAEKINLFIKPDIVLCLHFNAEAWGDSDQPKLVEANHLHLLVNGNYSLGELAHDDIRFEMLHRLVSGTHKEELALAMALAPAMAKSTGLPPYVYPGDNARPAGTNPYVFSRNLLANRLYRCPVIYFEPFVMNNKIVAKRLMKGYFTGRTLVEDRLEKSIYREYAEGIIKGLVEYYLKTRNQTETGVGSLQNDRESKAGRGGQSSNLSRSPQ